MAVAPPITGFYLGILSLFYLGLGTRVIWIRRRDLVGLGHGENRVLQRAIRAHGNFSEWVPMLLIAMLFLEFEGIGRVPIHLFGISLVISRILHAIGLTKSSGKSWGRFLGAGLSFMLLALAGVTLIYQALCR